MTKHQNGADALVHALQREPAKSMSDWANHKACTPKHIDNTDSEEEIQKTKTNNWYHSIRKERMKDQSVINVRSLVSYKDIILQS